MPFRKMWSCHEQHRAFPCDQGVYRIGYYHFYEYGAENPRRMSPGIFILIHHNTQAWNITVFNMDYRGIKNSCVNMGLPGK